MPNGTRPQYGQPFQQFPSATRRDLTPESITKEQIQTGRKQIWDRYTLQHNEINRSRRFIGAGKANAMQQQLHAKAKQELLQFDQQAQQQMTQLQNIDRLVQVGGLTEQQGAKIKTQETLGRDVAERMYPTPGKEKPPMQQFSELDTYSHRISDELENFRIVGEELPKPPPKALWAVSPPLAAISAYRKISKLKEIKKRDRRGELQIWDPNIPVKIPEVIRGKKTGKMLDEMGDWREAGSEEIAAYGTLIQEEEAITQRKTELFGQLDIQRRTVQPGTKGGTFGDKIAESVRPQRQRPAAKPKVIRQRNKRTGQERISYDGGKTWQIVTG